MRAKLIVAAVAALAVAALAAAQVPGKAPSKPPLNFTLNGKIKTVNFVDNAPDGASVGDVVVFTQTLRDLPRTRGGKRPRDLHPEPAAGHRVCSGVSSFPAGSSRSRASTPPEASSATR